MRDPQRVQEDELARRRAARERLRTVEQPGQINQDDETPQFGWSDILAMIIAAYQIIFPIVLIFAGVILGLYLLFRLFFS